MLAVVARHIGDGAAGVNNDVKHVRGAAQWQRGIKVALSHTGAAGKVGGMSGEEARTCLEA